MGIVYNPLLPVGLDQRGAGGGASVAGSNTEIQYNDSGSLGASADLTWDDAGKVLGVGGDVDLDDGGTYTTTLQTITATANRTISFPDATGTVGLVAGSSGQLIYNSAGANAGVPGSVVGATGDITLSLNGAASTPPLKLTGAWFSGGTATTTKPQLLIEPTGTTSTAWSTSGTGFGVNAASGFTGNLLDLQVGGTSKVYASSSAAVFNYGSTVSIDSRVRSSGGYATTSAGASAALLLNDALYLASNNLIRWSSNATDGYGTGAISVSLGRDADGILAQRNGTNAQTYRLYNTLTGSDVSATGNYERAFLQWNSSVFEIGTEAGSGGGSEQPVRITAATLKLPNLPTYADNTAATSGGLVAGDVYKTATGELRITV